MARSRNALLSRSVDDLADAKDLRYAVSTALHATPLDEHALRCAVWTFVGLERRAEVPPALVIRRLTDLIDNARIAPMSRRVELTERIVRWTVEEHFGHLGGNALARESTPTAVSPVVHS